MLTVRTRSLRPRLRLLVAAIGLALVMAALFVAVAIQPAAARRVDFSRVILSPTAHQASCTATQKADLLDGVSSDSPDVPLVLRRLGAEAFISASLRSSIIPRVSGVSGQ